MKTEYRRDLQHSYLVIQEEETKEQDYTVRMISENKIEGLLALEIRKIDRQILFYYDITSKISVAEYCQFRKVTGAEIISLLRRLVCILTSIEEYLLSGDCLCLQADYIYINAEFTDVEFCFLPGQKRNLAEQFQALMEYFLPVLNHEKREEMLTVYQIYGYAVQEHFSLDGLRKVLLEGEKTDEREEARGAKGRTEKPKTIEENAEYDFDSNMGECPDEVSGHESQWMKKREHERALEAFFEEEPEEKEKTSPWITLGAVLTALFLLGTWYVWRNWFSYRWIWMGISVPVIVAFLILSNRRVIKERVLCRKETEELQENNMRRNVEKENAKKGNVEPNAVRSDTLEKSRVQTEKNSVWETSDEWDVPLSEQEVYTRILQPGTAGGMAAFRACFPDTGRILPLTEKKIQMIGYQKGVADLVLESNMISRIHAKIRREGNHFYLSDMNSRNGTWINGEALEGKAERELYAGDEVKFADQIFHFIC